MIEDGMVAVIIKTAAMGLDRRHVGKTLQELESYLLHISDIYGCNPCGEGENMRHSQSIVLYSSVVLFCMHKNGNER